MRESGKTGEPRSLLTYMYKRKREVKSEGPINKADEDYTLSKGKPDTLMMFGRIESEGLSVGIQRCKLDMLSTKARTG